MRRLYGGHRIESIGLRKSGDSKWTARVVISWDEKGSAKFQRLAPQGAFESVAEAEAWGIRFGKKWIDQERSAQRQIMI